MVRNIAYISSIGTLCDVAIDINALTRFVEGTYLEQSLPSTTMVDEVIALDHLVLQSHPEFATAVIGSASNLLARLNSASAPDPALERAVFVTHNQSAQLLKRLRRSGINAIVGSRLAGDLLQARIESLLLGDQAADDRLITTGTKVLTQVARRGGATAVVIELAARIDGWAVLLDASGNEITSAGAGRLHTQDAQAVAFNRPVRVRHAGLQVHPIGSDAERVGYLVIASRSASTSRNRDLASQAAALLDLVLRTYDFSATERLGRDVLVGQLLEGGEKAVSLLRRWGVHESVLTGFALGSHTRSIELELLITRWFDEMGAVHTLTSRRDRIVGFLRTELVPDLSARVKALIVDGLPAVNIGFGRPAPVTRLSLSASEAKQALEIATSAREAVVHFEALPTVDFVIKHLPADERRSLVSLLDVFSGDAGDGAELTRTLEAFLLENGGHRSTARRLNIHRQTLANRLSRIEKLSGLSLSNPDHRTAFWLALRARRSDVESRKSEDFLGTPVQ